MINKLKDIIFALLHRERVIKISDGKLLEQKVVLITGASKGMGLTTAKYLLSKGARLVLMSRNMNELKNEFSKNTNNVLLIQGDITNEEDCKAGVAKAIGRFGSVDVLINNAGLFYGKLIEETSSEDWDKIMGVNIKGMFQITREIVPHMKKKGKGLIVNMGSKISHNTNVSMKKVLYATSKYAVEGFSTTLAKELQPFGIRVTCLMPATVNTYRHLEAAKYLSPLHIAKTIAFLIEMEDVNFEGIVVKSVYHNI